MVSPTSLPPSPASLPAAQKLVSPNCDSTAVSYSTAARSAAKRRIAPLFHDTPGRERRPPVGTLCAAQQRRIAPLLYDTQGRERRPPVGTAARSAAKGVYHAAIRMTLNTEVPAERGPPRNWGSFPPPAFGGLCRPEVGVPLPARRSARTTRSMRVALSDLGLERLFVVYPGDEGYALDARIEVLPVREIPRLPARPEFAAG